jgi:ferredoxin-NADP reductase
MSEYRYYIRKTHQPSSDIVIIEVADKKGRPVFEYRPGQYAMISYRNLKGQMEDKHAFSVAASPTRRDSIVFAIKIQGLFTQGLLNLKAGDEIIVYGPYGSFIYDEKKYSDLVLIAGGIGITPFFSALNYATDLNLNNKLSLIYSAKTIKGAPLFSEIRALEKNNNNISTLFSFSEEYGISQEANILHQRINAATIKSFIGDIYGKSFFICGPNVFMSAMVTNLLSLGVSKNQIEMEEFSMIPDKDMRSRLKNAGYAVSFAVILFFISFSLINRPVAPAAIKKYNLTEISLVNQAAYSRMASIYEAKNKALTDLNTQILAGNQNVGEAPVLPAAVDITQPKNSQPINTTVVSNTVSVPASSAVTPVIVSPPVVTIKPPVSQPVSHSQPAPAPTPTTRVS